MPPAPLPLLNGNVIEVRVVQKLAGQTLLNTLHYRADVTSTGATFPSVVTALDLALRGVDGFLTRLNAMQSESCLQQVVQYQIVSPLRFTAIEKPGLGNGQLVGEDGLAALPSNTALTVTRTIQEAKKGRVSTLHIGGLRSDQIVNSSTTLQSSLQLAAVGAASITIQALQGGVTLQPILFTRTAALQTKDLVDYKTGTTARTMRRRTVGLGI